MSKPKRKTKQQNLLQYSLNEFIPFRRDFTFITHLSSTEAAENLRHLTYEKQGCWRKRRIITDVTESDQVTRFTIKAEQPSKQQYILSAKASGEIYDADDGTILLEGSVTTGWELWFAIVFVAVIFTVTSIIQSIEPIWMISLLAIIFLVLWLRMYLDRNYLIKIIENAVTSEKRKVSA